MSKPHTLWPNPSHILAAHDFSSSFSRVINLFSVRMLVKKDDTERKSPNFFSFGISSHKTVDHGRLAGLSMSVFPADSVNFDVL